MYVSGSYRFDTIALGEAVNPSWTARTRSSGRRSCTTGRASFPDVLATVDIFDVEHIVGIHISLKLTIAEPDDSIVRLLLVLCCL